jgi:polyisoprenoid-binding protein YceI
MDTQRWEIDKAHSGIQFSVRHMVIAKVRGQFARWSGQILLDGTEIGHASVTVSIDVSSLTTGVDDRDTHLKSADFLDVANHPTIEFRSVRVESLGAGLLRVIGNLTIRGVTREVALHVEDNGRTADPWGHERAGFSAKAALDRKEFGLTWNQVMEAGGVMVGDRVDIEIEVEAIKQVEAEVN